MNTDITNEDKKNITTYAPRCSKHPTLKETLSKFDFAPYAASIARGEQRLPRDLLSQYQRVLEPYLVEEAPAPILIKTRPTPLNVTCTDPRFANVLTGRSRASPVKVIDMILFAYEVEILEMRLYELNDVVDVFVIAEAVSTQRFARKPLMFERYRDRFQDFEHKIVYIALDDTVVRKYRSSDDHVDGDDWRWEDGPRQEMFKRYRDTFGFPDDHTLLIHGDMDEMPLAPCIYALKHCEMNTQAAIIQTIMYRFNFEWVPPGLYYGEVLNVQTVEQASTTRFGRIRSDIRIHDGGIHLNRFGTPVLQLHKDN